MQGTGWLAFVLIGEEEHATTPSSSHWCCRRTTQGTLEGLLATDWSQEGLFSIMIWWLPLRLSFGLFGFLWLLELEVLIPNNKAGVTLLTIILPPCCV